MAALCNRGAIIFCPVVSFFILLFSSPIWAVAEWMSTILLHMVCGLSANLECRSEMCCTRLATNTGRKNDAKNRHLCTIAQLCRAISSQLRHVSTIGKKLVKQQYVPHMSLEYGELGPLAAEIVSLVLGTPANFNGFRVLAALLHGTLLVGVSQTAPHF